MSIEVKFHESTRPGHVGTFEYRAEVPGTIDYADLEREAITDLQTDYPGSTVTFAWDDDGSVFADVYQEGLELVGAADAHIIRGAE